MVWIFGGQFPEGHTQQHYGRALPPQEPGGCQEAFSGPAHSRPSWAWPGALLHSNWVSGALLDHEQECASAKWWGTCLCRTAGEVLTGQWWGSRDLHRGLLRGLCQPLSHSNWTLSGLADCPGFAGWVMGFERWSESLGFSCDTQLKMLRWLSSSQLVVGRLNMEYIYVPDRL